MTKKAERTAQRCFSGGMSAGVLACQLEKMHFQLRIGRRDSALSDLFDAEGHAKLVRLAFPQARPEARAIEDQLKRWNKEYRKTFRKPTGPAVGITAGGVGELKERLKQVVEKGAGICSSPRVPWSIEKLMMVFGDPPKSETTASVSGKRRKRR